LIPYKQGYDTPQRAAEAGFIPVIKIHINIVGCTTNINNLTHPTQDEAEFLTLGFNRFLDLHKEIVSDAFWDENPSQRFLKTKELFAVYSEILKYPPVQ
jgi:hypothetical protein